MSVTSFILLTLHHHINRYTFHCNHSSPQNSQFNIKSLIYTSIASRNVRPLPLRRSAFVKHRITKTSSICSQTRLEQHHKTTLDTANMGSTTTPSRPTNLAPLRRRLNMQPSLFHPPLSPATVTAIRPTQQHLPKISPRAKTAALSCPRYAPSPTKRTRSSLDQRPCRTRPGRQSCMLTSCQPLSLQAGSSRIQVSCLIGTR